MTSTQTSLDDWIQTFSLGLRRPARCPVELHPHGATERIRTVNLRLDRALLSPLSYGGIVRIQRLSRNGTVSSLPARGLAAEIWIYIPRLARLRAHGMKRKQAHQTQRGGPSELSADNDLFHVQKTRRSQPGQQHIKLGNSQQCVFPATRTISVEVKRLGDWTESPCAPGWSPGNPALRRCRRHRRWGEGSPPVGTWPTEPRRES